MTIFNTLFKTKHKANTPTPLYQAKHSFFTKIKDFLQGKKNLDSTTIEHLEELLIAADISIDTTFHLLKQLEKKKQLTTLENAISLLKQEIISIFNNSYPYQNIEVVNNSKPYIILVVGVNGVGKTTSIGKLSYQYKVMGKRVLLGAADTFRAAAIDQLKAWSQRNDIPIIAKVQGADPSSVVYDTVKSGIAKQMDILLIDTAGRLHNKTHLMQELSKIQRVIEKQIGTAPQEVFLVIDGSTGQNAIRQVHAFLEVTSITGFIVTKLDGTAKGGILISLADQFKIPIRYVGIGEKVQDLIPFNPEDYTNVLFD